MHVLLEHNALDSVCNHIFYSANRLASDKGVFQSIFTIHTAVFLPYDTSYREINALKTYTTRSLLDFRKAHLIINLRTKKPNVFIRSFIDPISGRFLSNTVRYEVPNKHKTYFLQPSGMENICIYI